MALSGVEVGIQLCFINKMEERSPSCVVSLDMDLFMGPFVVCAAHASDASRQSQSQSQPECKPSEEPGAGTQGAAKCVGLKLTGQRTGVVKGQRNDTHCHRPLPSFCLGTSTVCDVLSTWPVVPDFGPTG